MDVGRAPEPFAHIRDPKLRTKVATDFLERVSEDGAWNSAEYPPAALSDYGRHLYALFLRLTTTMPRELVERHISDISLDVPESKRRRYGADVCNSIIVGYNTRNPAPVWDQEGVQYGRLRPGDSAPVA